MGRDTMDVWPASHPRYISRGWGGGGIYLISGPMNTLPILADFYCMLGTYGIGDMQWMIVDRLPVGL